MYHQRRKSGNTSTTDFRELSARSSSKASRPTAMTRRSSTQTSQKLGRSPRERERDWDEDRWFEDERESFPQYWYVNMTPFLALLLQNASYGTFCRGGLCNKLPRGSHQTISWRACSVASQRPSMPSALVHLEARRGGQSCILVLCVRRKQQVLVVLCCPRTRSSLIGVCTLWTWSLIGMITNSLI